MVLAAVTSLTLARLKAYHACEVLFDVLLDAIAPTLCLGVERHTVPINGESVKVYALLPTGSQTPVPGVLVSNGLKGTNFETICTALRTKAILSSVWFFMETPGTYAYKQPMTKSSSELIYKEVLTLTASHQRIDGSCLAMLGISFGGNCAMRMAIVDKHLKAVVINGAPLGRSLSFSGSFGMPGIVVRALFSVLGAKKLPDLKANLIPGRISSRLNVVFWRSMGTRIH
ncbi:alpha beta hydrolase family domain-containing protein [Fusarium coicis]|nr:alpha beta hydrolase family domain-containing protein [Fusarium coicis]